MAAIRTSKQKLQHTFWLGCGLLCLSGALIAWAITDQDQLEVVEVAKEAQIPVQIQPEKVAATTHLGGLLEQVRPLDMTTRVVATGQHEAEFRGNKFIEDNKNKYVIELFRVSEEQIINTFLKKQTQRKDYRYLRLSGENQAEQYVMLYGLYGNQDQAKAALAATNFGLPKSAQAHVAALSDYQAFVNDMGSDELGLNKKLYEVRLRPVALPRVDESVLAEAKRNLARQQALTRTTPRQAAVSPQSQNQTAPTIDPEKATTSTTIVRRDQQGTVVDVEKTQSQSNGE